MDRAANNSVGDERGAATLEMVRRKLSAAFSHSFAIGFAILDNHLRYEAVNERLAEIHGIPARAHLGHTVLEILGEIGARAAPRYERVLANGEGLCFEITSAVLPGGLQGAYSVLKSCFPIHGHAGDVNELGIMAVDVTEQRRVEKRLYELAANLSAETSATSWLAQELHNSIEQYQLALALSLELLIHELERNTTLWEGSIKKLDQRIAAMNTLVSAVASGLPISR